MTKYTLERTPYVLEDCLSAAKPSASACRSVQLTHEPWERMVILGVIHTLDTKDDDLDGGHPRVEVIGQFIGDLPLVAEHLVCEGLFQEAKKKHVICFRRSLRLCSRGSVWSVPKGIVPKVMSRKGMGPKGMTRKGMTPKGMTRKGMARKGMTRKGMTRKGMTHRYAGPCSESRF